MDVQSPLYLGYYDGWAETNRFLTSLGAWLSDDTRSFAFLPGSHRAIVFYNQSTLQAVSDCEFACEAGRRYRLFYRVVNPDTQESIDDQFFMYWEPHQATNNVVGGKTVTPRGNMIAYNLQLRPLALDITDEKALSAIMTGPHDWMVRRQAISVVTNESLLTTVLRGDPDKRLRFSAADRLREIKGEKLKATTAFSPPLAAYDEYERARAGAVEDVLVEIEAWTWKKAIYVALVDGLYRDEWRNCRKFRFLPGRHSMTLDQVQGPLRGTLSASLLAGHKYKLTWEEPGAFMDRDHPGRLKLILIDTEGDAVVATSEDN